MKIAGALLVLAATITPVLAQGGDGRQIMTLGSFSEMRAACRGGDVDEKLLCIGRVIGAMGMLDMLKPDTICPPQTLPIGELADEAFDILDQVPDFGGMPETQGLLFGLGLAYPCPK
jgi:hypothetical protein